MFEQRETPKPFGQSNCQETASFRRCQVFPARCLFYFNLLFTVLDSPVSRYYRRNREIPARLDCLMCQVSRGPSTAVAAQLAVPWPSYSVSGSGQRQSRNLHLFTLHKLGLDSFVSALLPPPSRLNILSFRSLTSHATLSSLINT
jgi:hypothetical protein